MAHFTTADLCIHLILLLCVVGLPWALLSYGLRTNIRPMILDEEDTPPRHAALMPRYHDFS